MQNIDIALVYFLSISLLLSNLALGFFDLLIAPVFILGISYLLRRKFFLAVLFYLLSLTFNWTLLIFAPPFLIFILSNRKNTKLFTINTILSVLFIVLFVILTYSNSFIIPPSFFSSRSSQILGLPWLLQKILPLLSQYYKTYPKEILAILPFATPILPIIYLVLYKKLLSFAKINEVIIFTFSFTVYYIFLLLFPVIPAGNLGWLVILALLIFIFHPSQANKMKLLITNIFVFVLLFSMFGTNTQTPGINTEYFDIFKILFSISFIVYGIWNVISLFHYFCNNNF